MQAAALATRTGVTADRALLSEGFLSAQHFYELLSEFLGLGFLHHPLPVAEYVDIDIAMAAEIVPMAPNVAGIDMVIAPRGETLAALIRRYDHQPWRGAARVAVTTPQRLAALVRFRHRPTIVREASHALPDWNPRLSALAGWSLGQKIAGFCVGFALAFGLGYAPRSTLETVSLCFSALFLAMVVTRLAATLASLRRPAKARSRRRDDDLPLYTVVVPLYRESRIVPDLIKALSRLDYPAARLDIKIVLEADDRTTLDALQAQRLPARFDILLAPSGRPRTKPRALNIALRFALGDYVVIYDAEDEPEPGQLREAVDAFEAAGPGLGCLQARLAIDNVADGWLARLFAIEYAALFDVINPGLAQLRLPIALGGTSNHFRMDALRHVNGWDAWNVTEDADLGIRLARFGYAVGALASTTFEEAPARLRAWLGQRQRWQKGWIVTLQTHSRDPARLFAELGLFGGVSALALLCGTVATSLLGPFFLADVVIDAACGPLLHPSTDGERAWSVLVALVLLSGAVSLLAPVGLGLHRRGLGRLAASVGLLPGYLLLVSLASWRALFEMMGRPHAWTKTEHGVALHRTSRP